MALARIGSPAALAAIRSAASPGYEPLSSWWHPPEPDAEVVAALAKRTDPRSRSRRSPILRCSANGEGLGVLRRVAGSKIRRATNGSCFRARRWVAWDDLWLSRRDPGGEWEPGEFIGQIAPGLRAPATPQTSARVRYPERPALHRRCRWLVRLGVLTSIRLDRDGDGLSDLVEARILTDPERVDTDGDGLSDPLDPAPNARTRRPRPRKKRVIAVLRQMQPARAVAPSSPLVEFIIGDTAPEWRTGAP